ncbi:ferric reductase-like transmembrane domain-containing protein [Streptomyces yaanensis]|uniref:Ferric reductase-like transmembrane domain-containing protein n=1 Tax=Streptomyces yaanensis TaxID=1142239 RepID=A0ABV7SKF1_9ACTN|nr:ferric reductase-like transmembrane domain-containing protein [Streptomyces sp. CGMCC 4.7035]WNC00387.1 ferric reductase-like transmembrane domain-containing protein [Streptomyces sp. CGMCC 4.7035]
MRPEVTSLPSTGHGDSYSMLCMFRRPRWGIWILGCVFIGLTASVLRLGPTSGWLTSLAVLPGTLAYAMMATNLLLATRQPVLERLFGPLDRVYVAHRLIGTIIVGVLGLHLVLIPIASTVDRRTSILDDLSMALPLGAAGTLLLVGSIALAMNTKVPYDKWQRVHMATGLAFLVLTAHMLSAASLWFSLTGPLGGVLGFFALLGIASLIVRVVDKARGGVRYAIVETVQRERGLEVVMQPEGARRIAPQRPGQFVFLTATAAGARETHPFTLTSAEGDGRISVLIRPSGNWTGAAQTGLSVTDQVRVEGPLGAFTPSAGADAPQHQVWIAGGAGITPFLSVLRTAQRASDADQPSHGKVELVVAARDACDVPCWEDLSKYARKLPWLTLTPAFSALGGRLDEGAVDRLAASRPEGTVWYLCGPAGLTSMIQHRLKQDSSAHRQVHRELYEWRAVARGRQ